MGKESRLRNPKPRESKYNYTNGDRKLYDRDSMPEGLDSDIWDMVLYFEQYAERNGYSIPGRPISYTELYHRIQSDSELSKLLRSQDAQYTRPRDTDGICGIRPTEVNLLGLDSLCIFIVHKMINCYWDISLPIDIDYDHSINNFCSVTVFNYIRDYVVSDIKRSILFATGIRVTQEDWNLRPSRWREEDREAFITLNSPRTEEESRGTIANWKKTHRESS